MMMSFAIPGSARWPVLQDRICAVLVVHKLIGPAAVAHVATIHRVICPLPESVIT